METLVESNVDQVTWYKKSKYDFTNDWFLMDSPFPSVIIVLVYLVFILKLGPAVMANREPFQLKTTLLIYNIFQVFLSIYIFLWGALCLFFYGLIDTKCPLNDLAAQKMILSFFYIFYIGKVVELMDTVFFVLRKKKNQITFLHVYHHCMMLLSTFAMLKYGPSYSVTFAETINSLVHVVMYAYYGLSAFPSMEKYLWWKKYLTTFQLIQFGLIFIHVTVSSLVSKCPPSYPLIFNVLFNALLLTYLFSDFYVKSYVKKGSYANATKDSKNYEKQENNGVTRRHVGN